VPDAGKFLELFNVVEVEDLAAGILKLLNLAIPDQFLLIL